MTICDGCDSAKLVSSRHVKVGTDHKETSITFHQDLCDRCFANLLNHINPFLKGIRTTFEERQKK